MTKCSLIAKTYPIIAGVRGELDLLGHPTTIIESVTTTVHMTKAIRINDFGGPDVLQWVDIEVGEPGPGEVRVRHTASGLNFIDTYHRSGLYPLPLPTGLGTEAAGIVEAVGSGVSEVAVGDRVCYVHLPPDAYSEARLVPAKSLVKVPRAVSDEQAAGMMLKGLTAWYLLKRSYPVRRGDTVLFYAAAGGVGLIACQWAAHLGARVIGVVSTPEKAELARAHGCAEIIFADQDVSKQARSLTGGVGVPAVYDSVGKETFFSSLDALRPHGVLVSYGNASGPVEPFALSELASRGSLFVTRPVLFDFIATPEDLRAGSQALFDVVLAGAVTIEVHQRYAMKDAATAHRDLEARRTTGSTVLIPE
jgi:NADPH2:quinone reductase